MTKCIFFCYIVCFFLLSVQGTFGQKKQKIDSLKRIIKEFGSVSSEKDSAYIKVICELSAAYRFVDSDSLLHFNQMADQLNSYLESDYLQALIFRNSGFYHSDIGKNSEAINAYNQALSLVENLRDLSLKLKLLIWLSDEYYYLGDYENELNILLEVLDVGDFNEADHLIPLSVANENIADLYANQNNFDTALEFYANTLEINKKIKIDKVTAQTYSNLADVYTQMGNLKVAMDYVDKSIAIFEKEDIVEWMAYAYGVKGMIFSKKNEFQTALEWFKSAESLHKEIDDARAKTVLYLEIANAYSKLEDFESARDYITAANKLSDRLTDLMVSAKCAETSYEIWKEQNNTSKALEYLEAYQKLSDSLSDQNITRSLGLFRTKVKFENEKRELIETTRKEVRRQKVLVAVSLLVAIILLSTLIPLYLKQKKVNKLNHELEVNSKVLRANEDQLIELNNSKDMLFSILGHDLKGPIANLQNALNMYADKNINFIELKEYLPSLKRNVDHVLFTLNNLLNWGHAQIKGVDFDPKKFDLKAIIENNINFLAEVAIAKGISIESDLPENIDVFADKNEISLVVRNLISNALKFTPVNGDRVRISAEKTKTHWKIIVRDHGVGISRGRQKLVFKEILKNPNLGTRREKGTGLGLFLSKEMVLKNKGEIWVESIVNEGSTFYFTVPKEENFI